MPRGKNHKPQQVMVTLKRKPITPSNDLGVKLHELGIANQYLHAYFTQANDLYSATLTAHYIAEIEELSAKMIAITDTRLRQMFQEKIDANRIAYETGAHPDPKVDDKTKEAIMETVEADRNMQVLRAAMYEAVDNARKNHLNYQNILSRTNSSTPKPRRELINQYLAGTHVLLGHYELFGISPTQPQATITAQLQKIFDTYYKPAFAHYKKSTDNEAKKVGFQTALLEDILIRLANKQVTAFLAEKDVVYLQERFDEIADKVPSPHNFALFSNFSNFLLNYGNPEAAYKLWEAAKDAFEKADFKGMNPREISAAQLQMVGLCSGILRFLEYLTTNVAIYQTDKIKQYQKIANRYESVVPFARSVDKQITPAGAEMSEALQGLLRDQARVKALLTEVTRLQRVGRSHEAPARSRQKTSSAIDENIHTLSTPKAGTLFSTERIIKAAKGEQPISKALAFAAQGSAAIYNDLLRIHNNKQPLKNLPRLGKSKEAPDRLVTPPRPPRQPSKPLLTEADFSSDLAALRSGKTTIGLGDKGVGYKELFPSAILPPPQRLTLPPIPERDPKRIGISADDNRLAERPHKPWQSRVAFERYLERTGITQRG